MQSHQEFKNMGVLCTFIIIQTVKTHHKCFKAKDLDFEIMGILCTFKINLDSNNLEHGVIKPKAPYLRLI